MSDFYKQSREFRQIGEQTIKHAPFSQCEIGYRDSFANIGPPHVHVLVVVEESYSWCHNSDVRALRYDFRPCLHFSFTCLPGAESGVFIIPFS